MALPVIRSLSDCSDFTTTVFPFVHQISELPQQLFQSWNNPTELQVLYLATNPLISAFLFSLFISPIFLIVSEINKNYSQVDRCWSLLPTIYIAHYTLYAHLAGLPHQRLDNLLAVSVVWSVSIPNASETLLTKLQIRLTFNYWRKGGYSIGSEDYRWYSKLQVFHIAYTNTHQGSSASKDSTCTFLRIQRCVHLLRAKHSPLLGRNAHIRYAISLKTRRDINR